MPTRDEILAKLKGQAANAKVKAAPADLADRLAAKPEPNPLADVEYTGDIETDQAAEVTALQAGFRERAKNEDERFRLATDSAYHFTLCFRDRADKEKFLRLAGADSSAGPLIEIGDLHLDGYEAARRLGIDMTKEG